MFKAVAIFVDSRKSDILFVIIPSHENLEKASLVMPKVINTTTIYLPKTKVGNKCMWKCMRTITHKAPFWNKWFIIYFLPIYITV